METATIVPDPEKIKGLSELEDILSKILDYEAKKGYNAGVLALQRRQFSGTYRIRTETEAEDMIRNPQKCE